MEELPGTRPVSRRGLLVGGAGATVAATLLAACSTDPGPSSGYGAPAGTADSGGAAAPGPTASSPPASGATTAGGGELVRLDEVPVGGAVSAQDSGGNPVIVAQPSKGKVVAFSAICTHMGCTVAPAEGRLQCPCHGSTFDPATGANTGGPAPRPLARVRVEVVDGAVVEA